jgi:ribonuclease P/MRP protein subunit POP1
VSDNDSQFKRSAVLENGEDFCTHAILSLRVKDPRIMPETGIADVPESLSAGMLSVPEAEMKEHVALTGISDNKKELLLSICSKPEGKSPVYYDNELWNNSSGVSLPVDESVLCMERHNLHMDNFCLDDPNSGVMNTSTKVQCSRSCPILLLKNNNQKGSLIG